MKTTIVCAKKYKGNTFKLAQAIAQALDAQVFEPKDAPVTAVLESDLVGFGSGIFFGKHDSSLLEFVDKLPNTQKSAFIFSTRGRTKFFQNFYHRTLRNKLVEKGFKVVGEFSCRGFTDYYRLFRLFGGVNKGHPNAKDLDAARDWAISTVSGEF